MTNRRAVLTGFAAAVGGATLGRAGTANACNRLWHEAEHESPGTDSTCKLPHSGLTADRFPNVLVLDQYGRKLRFYEDLIKHRTVMIQFMSTATEGDLNTVANLVQVQHVLGDRLGRDFYLYSITVDPETDTPPVLAQYAMRHGARWPFLTGYPKDMQAIRDALFFRPGGHHGHHGDSQDCSMGLMRYGNDAAGLWGAVPTRTAPEWIAERLSWMQPRSVPQGAPRRRGPLPRQS